MFHVAVGMLFAAFTQANFVELFPSERTTVGEMLDALDGLLQG